METKIDYIIVQSLINEDDSLSRIERYDRKLRQAADRLGLDLCNADDFKTITNEVDKIITREKEQKENNSRSIFNMIHESQQEKIFN